MNIRSFITALLTTALCVGVFGAAFGQQGPSPVIVTKRAKWATWGPNGPVGTQADTAMLDGAATDTTGPIYIGDMAFLSGPAAVSSTPSYGMKISVIGNGVADNVDSVYYRIEGSPDGNHWTLVLAAEALNNQIGAIAGIDQGNATAGTTTGNCVSWFVRIDPDQVVDGASATAALFNHAWVWSPYIRIFFRTLASDVWKAGELYVSYPGFRAAN
jgi:hypothetical protein